MVKTPRTRHSQSQRKPVTIDLDPDQVKREAAKASSETKASSEAKPDAGSAQAASSTKPDAEKTASDKPESAKAASEAGRRGDDKAAKDPAPEKPGTDEKPKATSTKPAESASQAGRGGALAAGVAGGVIALLLAGGLQWAGVLPGLNAEDQTPDPAIVALREQISGMEAKLAEQESQLSSIGSSGNEEVSTALAEATRLADSNEARILELGTQLSALQEAVSSGEAGGGAGLQQLSERLFQIEEKTANIAAEDGAGPALEEVNSRISALESSLADATSAASTNGERLTALSSEIESLTARLEAEDEGPRMAQVIAATALKSAVERGTPFSSELDTYAAIAPEAQAEALSPLRELADRGVPSRAALAAEAPKAASRIAAAANRATGDEGGVIDNLMASARSLVTVRPVGSVGGEDAAAIAARMEAAVLANDYEKALAEYEALPDAAKQAASDFANQLAARQAADQALEQALSNALKGA